MALVYNSHNAGGQPDLISAETDALKRSIKNHEEHDSFWGGCKDVASATTICCAIAVAVFIGVVALIRKGHESEPSYSTFKKVMFGVTGMFALSVLMGSALVIGLIGGLWYNWVKRPELKDQCQTELASINSGVSSTNYSPPAYGVVNHGTGYNSPPPYVVEPDVSTPVLYPKLN